LVTSRDIDFIRRENYETTKIADVMVPRDRLIVGDKNLTLLQTYTILEKEKKGFFGILHK